ncbi:MAG: hypothetical protein HZB98_08120, partial [Bacteroidia bacterium]|nr:hypothetical protein [Bacteroidia bacterium]
MIRQKLILSFIFTAAVISVSAQEVVTGLQSNYSIITSGENTKKGASSLSAGMAELPFYDDFSGNSIYPDLTKWTDSFVFINDTYSDKQITTGIAT